MIEFKKLTAQEEILSALNEFIDIFPHLLEKIDSLFDYSVKLSKFANVAVAAENTTNIGIIVYYSNDFSTKTGYISLIVVKENFRGKNVGKQLLNYAVNVMRISGMEQLKLEVDDDNDNAVKFYKKAGFDFADSASSSSKYMIKKI